MQIHKLVLSAIILLLVCAKGAVVTAAGSKKATKERPAYDTLSGAEKKCLDKGRLYLGHVCQLFVHPDYATCSDKTKWINGECLEPKLDPAHSGDNDSRPSGKDSLQ